MTNKDIVIQLINEVWSNGNLEIVNQLIAPAYTIRHDPGDPWEGQTLDLSTFKERVKHSRAIFPDLKFYIEDIFQENDKVAVSWKLTGTQKGTIPSLPTSNKFISITGLTIYYLANKKIIGHWQIVDRLDFLKQLGI